MTHDFAAANESAGDDLVATETDRLATETDRLATETERRMLTTFDEIFLVDEPIPDELITLAQDCYTWRTVDAELLDLLIDSAETELAVVRDDDRLQRFIAFGDEDRGVHFECVTLEGDVFQITGIMVPAGVYSVRVDRVGEDIEMITDDLGSFSLGPLASGSIRLTIRTIAATESAETEAVMVTPWFMLQS